MKTFVAYSPGICAECKVAFPRGATLRWGRNKGDRCHVDCSKPDTTPQSRDETIIPIETLENPSPMQTAIFDRILDPSSGNLIVEAVAGSGKTTTIVVAAGKLPQNTSAWFLAFGKKNSLTLKNRLPNYVEAATFHSVCYRAWRKTQRGVNITVDKHKSRILLQKMVENGVVRRDIAQTYGSSAIQLCGLAKGAGIGLLVPDTIENWAGIVEHFGIVFEDAALNDDDAREVGISLARQLFADGNSNRTLIDFDDMLYLCLADNTPFERQDFIFIDEAQDTNAIQRVLLKRMLKPTGRICAVGDTHQAIYGFRGADSTAMALLKEEFDCDELPLSVSYRCPKTVIAEAQVYVPEISSSDDAIDGEVVQHQTWDVKDFTKDDAVICRTTAPLIKLAYQCLAKNVGCQVAGRSIGEGLVSLIKKLRAKSIEELSRKLTEYRTAEVTRLLAKYEETKAQAIEDKCDCIEVAIGALEGPRTVQNLIQRIESLFDDKEHGILTLSTIHKAKGDEWDKVFILDRDLMPHKMARQCWQREQEYNLIYVAYTRAKKSLNFIQSGTIQ